MIPSLTINGVSTDIDIVSVKRSAETLDKYAERTEDGVLHREPIGVYYNYQIKFGWSIDRPDEYDRLSYQLSEAKEFHSISAPYGLSGNRAFEGYISSVSDELFFRHGQGQYWRSLSASLIPKSPSRVYGSARSTEVVIPAGQLTDCKRKFDSLDESAERTENGELHRKLIGVFHNYQLKFAWSLGGDAWYHDFWETITAPVDFHTVTVPDRQLGNITQEAYFSGVSDELFLARDGVYYWRNLSANLIARSPARAGSSLSA